MAATGQNRTLATEFRRKAPIKMNTEIQMLKAALNRCEELLISDPEFPPLQSIEVQLQYLIGILEGQTDRSRLEEIIIGRYAAREFEDRDMAFANLLYEVEEIVDLMKAGQL
jgi:hypothetical protein